MQLPIEMYKNYVHRRSDDLKELRSSLESGDVTAFRKIGHQLKGNATSFGFDDLLTLATRMHELTPENFSADGLLIVNDFHHWIIDKKKKYSIG